MADGIRHQVEPCLKQDIPFEATLVHQGRFLAETAKDPQPFHEQQSTSEGAMGINDEIVMVLRVFGDKTIER